MSDPRPPHEDFNHIRDRQASRTRIELWVIYALVGAILVISLSWRAITATHAGPQAGYGPTPNAPAASNVQTMPAAAAGTPPGGLGEPTSH